MSGTRSPLVLPGAHQITFGSLKARRAICERPVLVPPIGMRRGAERIGETGDGPVNLRKDRLGVYPA